VFCGPSSTSRISTNSFLALIPSLLDPQPPLSSYTPLCNLLLSLEHVHDGRFPILGVRSNGSQIPAGTYNTSPLGPPTTPSLPSNRPIKRTETPLPNRSPQPIGRLYRALPSPYRIPIPESLHLTVKHPPRFVYPVLLRISSF
jgi:hypothetical protein